MKRYLKTLLVSSAAIFALSVSSFGQLQTYQTVSAFTGSITNIASGREFGQTFTSATFIESITYRFSTTNTGVFAGTTLNAYFTQWDSTNNRAIGPALFSQAITTANSAGFTNFTDANSGQYRGSDFTFTLSLATSPGLTYAMILVGNSASNPGSIGLQVIADTDAFAFGDRVARNNGISTDLATGYSNLTTFTGQNVFIGEDWGFSNISATIIPEPSTAAAALVAGFLGVMVIRRRLQRTKVQPVLAA